MVWCKTEESARLVVISNLTDESIKSVTIGYDEDRKMWYVFRETFTEKEWEIKNVI